MTLSQTAPELRDDISKMPRAPVSSRLGRWLIRTAMRLLMRDKQHEGVRLEKAVTKEGVHLRIFTPEAPLTGAALLWIHGGGMVIGAAAQDDAFCAETARELKIVVISTEYRLAPESPFPAPLDDCLSAWHWIQTAAQQRNIAANRVAIGGQSAGGGLSASLVQRIHDMGGTQPAAQWLFCPMLDDRTAVSHAFDGIGHLIWNNSQNRTGWGAYLGDEFGASHVSEYAVPARRDDLRGLPPAWIGVGDIELFFAEDKAYAERLSASGVDCTLDIVTGAPHGFERIAVNTKLAQDYLSRARTWLAEKLAVTPA